MDARKHHVHWGNLILTLAIGGVIGYFIGKNNATMATTPAKTTTP